jgi:4-amino-4-deoxy-L-arabinose transferase-like glycosyltransferase
MYQGREVSIRQPFLVAGQKKSSRAWIGLILFTLALLTLSIWKGGLSGTDPPRVAGIAREMAVTSNYLIPRLHGENFLEYPPLGYWPIALTLSMSKNPPDFLAFLPIVFFGIGTVLITFLIGKTLAGERIGLIAGFILSTLSGFCGLHRHCLVDPALLFFVTLSLYGFVGGYRASKGNFLFFAVFYLAMAGAFLSKGIIGVAIPAATAMVFLIIRRDLAGIRKLFLKPGILFFMLPVLLWMGSVWYFDGFGTLGEVFRQSLWRFVSPSADHAKPFHFYLIPVVLKFLPWTFLPLVLIWFRRGRGHSPGPLSQGPLLKFSLVWFLTVLIGLSLASAKRPLYLGPIYPSFALLAALGWDRFREEFPRVKRGEAYGLIVIFLVYVGAYLVFIIPSERERSLRPIFETVSRQQVNGPVYLVNPSETIRGAAFFYLGKRMPVLDDRDVLQERFENRPGTTLVIEVSLGSNQLLSFLQSKGYRPLLQKRLRGNGVIWVCSKNV